MTLTAFDVKPGSKVYGALRLSVLLQGVASDTINSQVEQLTMINPRRFSYGSEEQCFGAREELQISL